MSAPRWTPEEIAALAEGLVEDVAERARLEEIVASDAEAKALFDALRGDIARQSVSQFSEFRQTGTGGVQCRRRQSPDPSRSAHAGTAPSRSQAPNSAAVNR